MATTDDIFELHSCRRLFEQYPRSTSLQFAVETIERSVRTEPGIAFTHCRGLLETVCTTILADRGTDVPENADPRWLMSQALQTLELTALNPDDSKAEHGVRDVLKGMNLIVSGVADLRNSQGVGPHGRDALQSTLSAEYAIMTATAVDVAVGLMFRLHMEQLGRDPVNHLRFGTHADYDEYLDSEYKIVVEEAPISASQALHRQDRQAYRAGLVAFRNRGQGEESDTDILEGESLPEDSDG